MGGEVGRRRDGRIAQRRDGWIVAAAVVVFVLHCAVFLQYTIDDSLISYRFARNWAEGFGPVYNVGERVEGYTCFGWVALLAGTDRVGIDVETASKALGIAGGVACAYLRSPRCREGCWAGVGRI